MQTTEEKMSDRFSNEQLIEEVKNREPLWDRKNEYYTNRARVDKEWNSLAKAVCRSKDKMKQRWRNIRDTYQRELKKLERTPDGELGVYTGKWAYFHQLNFLQDTLLPNVEKNFEIKKFYDSVQNRNQNYQENEDNDSDSFEEPDSPHRDYIKIEPAEFEIPVASQKNEVAQFKAKKRKVSDFDDPLEREEQTTSQSRHLDSDIDDDMCFVKSLVPYLRRLNPVRKLIVRNEMQKLLINQLLCERCRSNGPIDNCSCSS